MIHNARSTLDWIPKWPQLTRHFSPHGQIKFRSDIEPGPAPEQRDWGGKNNNWGAQTQMKTKNKACFRGTIIVRDHEGSLDQNEKRSSLRLDLFFRPKLGEDQNKKVSAQTGPVSPPKIK